MINISRKLYLFLNAMAFVSCAFSQQNVKSFPECMVEVSFLGQPTAVDETSNSPLKEFGKSMGRLSGPLWQYPSIEFDMPNKWQMAFCSCPDEPQLSSFRNELARPSQFMYKKNISGVGSAITTPVIELPVKDCKGCSMTQIVSPAKNPGCFLIQFAFSREGSYASTKFQDNFFSSVKDLGNDRLRAADEARVANVAEERAKRENERKSTELEEERRRLTQERDRLEADKAQREQAKLASRIAIQASATKPDTDGNFVINIETTADTASLKIDGEEKGGSQSGRYSIRRVARVGQNNVITITARDIHGNADSKTITVVRQVADSSPIFEQLNPSNIKSQSPRDAVAIIIGVESYKQISKAEFARQDAQDFYDYASRALGIKQENVKLLLDDEADVPGILKAFQNWLPLKVHKGKTDVYVFYSGHGLMSDDGTARYFLPFGVDKDLLADTAINQKRIITALQSAQPKSVTMFIESCYSGQTRTGETLLTDARPLGFKVNEMAYPADFTVITASASDQIASSSSKLKHGIFSYYLMKGLEGDADDSKDGTITFGKLQRYLSERVPRFAMTISRKQDPQLFGDPNRILVGR